jgi:dTDP-glucose 4,6-dehydratase
MSTGLRIVLAGGAGFVGSHLCDYFLARGDSVVVADNLITGAARNLAHQQGNPRFTFVHQNVSDGLAVDGPVDVVLNLASPASPFDYLKYPLETLAVGSEGTRHCLELARQKKARFLMASTSECYGDPEVHPQVETYWGHVNPIGPRSVYDEAKRFSEAITMAYHRTSAVDTRIVRIFNTYGPRMKLNDGRVVPAFLDQALRGEPLTVFGDGSQTRSFCYVSDLVEGIARLALADPSPEIHDPVNIGNPNEISIRRFADVILKLTGSNGNARIENRPLPQDDPKQRCPDITRAGRLLGWSPKVQLEEGLRLTVEYFRDLIAK